MEPLGGLDSVASKVLRFERLRARWLLTREPLVREELAAIPEMITGGLFEPIATSLRIALNVNFDAVSAYEERFPITPYETLKSKFVANDVLVSDVELRLRKHMEMVHEARFAHPMFERKRLYLEAMVNDLRSEPRGISEYTVISDKRMFKRPHDARNHAIRLQRGMKSKTVPFLPAASVLDLLYIILHIDWVGVDDETGALLQKVIAHDAKHVGLGTFKRSELNVVPGVMVQPLIERFCVVRMVDISTAVLLDMAVFLANTCRNVNRKLELVHTQGPEIALFEYGEQGDRKTTYGLFARRDYAPPPPKNSKENPEQVCRYGGVRMSRDLAVIWSSGEEAAKYASAYTVGIKPGKLDEPEDDWLVDGKLFWMLSQPGRFINQASVPGEVNCQFFELAEGETTHCSETAAVMNIGVEVTRKIKAGEQFFANYGHLYIPQMLPPDMVPLHLQACIQCKVNPVKVKCGHVCNEALYCGQECAQLDWNKHKQTCSK